MFGGHNHIQWAGYMGNIPFLQVQTPSNNIHMPQYDEVWAAELPEGYVAVDRELYSLSEDLWDTVIYNIKENKINVVRFGVGEDAEYTLD